jgi:hypothetical protein
MINHFSINFSKGTSINSPYWSFNFDTTCTSFTRRYSETARAGGWEGWYPFCFGKFDSSFLLFGQKISNSFNFEGKSLKTSQILRENIPEFLIFWNKNTSSSSWFWKKYISSFLKFYIFPIPQNILFLSPRAARNSIAQTALYLQKNDRICNRKHVL